MGFLFLIIVVAAVVAIRESIKLSCPFRAVNQRIVIRVTRVIGKFDSLNAEVSENPVLAMFTRLLFLGGCRRVLEDRQPVRMNDRQIAEFLSWR